MGRVQGTPEIQTPNQTPNQNPNLNANHHHHHQGQQQMAGSNNYPTPGQTPYIGNPWHSGLFECDQDPTNAVMTAIFPCVTFGQIAEVMDASQPSPGASQFSCPFGSFVYLASMVVCSQCVVGSKYRTSLRNRYGLVEAPYQDAIAHLFCPFCSLCQEFRELKSRHLDPALGWQGILAQRQAMQSRNDQINKPPQPQAMSM